MSCRLHRFYGAVDGRNLQLEQEAKIAIFVDWETVLSTCVR